MLSARCREPCSSQFSPRLQVRVISTSNIYLFILFKCTPHTTVILRWPNTASARSAECGEAFVDFIAASKVWNDCATVILVGHNSSSFDAPVLLRTLLRYSPQLIPKVKELNFHFAQSCFYLKAHQRKMSSVENTG